MTAAIARVLSTLAIVGLWGVLNRTSDPAGDLAEVTVQCELAPPRDIGGLEACLARASRDAALLIDPRDSASITRAMARVLSEPELRTEMIRRGHERVKAFSWAKSAARVREVYHEVAEEARRG